MFGQEPWVLYPCSNGIHEEKSGESNGVGKEDIGGPYLPVFFWNEIRATPWLLCGPEGNWVFSVVKFPLSVGNVLGNLYPARYGPRFTGWSCTESGYPSLMEIGDPKGGRPS